MVLSFTNGLGKPDLTKVFFDLKRQQKHAFAYTMTWF